MKINELPDLEKPREKAIQFGIDSLSNAELLAIILHTGTKDKSVLELSYELIEKFQGLEGFKNLTYQELSECKGLKKAKAISILAVIEIAKRINYQNNDKTLINNIDKAYELLEPIYSDDLQEKLIVLFLNRRNYLVFKKVIFIGGLDHHIVHPRDIFREAIKLNCVKIILAHNHPSGDATPSKEDIETTKTLIRIGSMLGIKVLDHLIIGKGEYFSIAQNNKLIFNINVDKNIEQC